MKKYLDTLQYILDNGTEKENRTGVSTLSTFSYLLKHNMNEGFPILTTKAVSWKNIVIEMLWFLGKYRGSKNRKCDFFKKHDVNFWLPWQDEFGNLPESYAEHWRNYPDYWKLECSNAFDGFDQIKAIIDALKKDPNNRRLVLDRWYAPLAWEEKLPPCFYSSVFNVQRTKTGEPRLCLANIGRSVDSFVGLPYNLAGFGLLLSLVAHLTGLTPGEASFLLVDCHLYNNHMDAVKEQLSRTPKTLPSVEISKDLRTLEDVDELIRSGTTENILDKFRLIGYTPDKNIKVPVAV